MKEKTATTINKRPRLPSWIRVRVNSGSGRTEVANILQQSHLNTVCSSAHCPNLSECWHQHTATFMIMGNGCTRNCKFCAVPHQPAPAPPEEDEPARLTEAVVRMGLRYVVITSVTRDDLPDGGANHFVAVINALHQRIPDIKIEILTPDFQGKLEPLQTVLEARPTVFNHNVETVQRLAKQIRNRATYECSMRVLANAAQISDIPVKTGLMVGVGETDDEVVTTIRELHAVGASILTIGQYLPPSDNHWPLQRYVEPEKFTEWAEFAREIGFSFVVSAPLVRSSYNAAEALDAVISPNSR